MSALTPDSYVVLVQNRETDPRDELRGRVEAFFKNANIPLETVVLTSRNCPVPSPAGPRPNLIIVLGGDGTFLRAAQCFAQDNIPLVGVNTGHLGFLTRIEANRLEEHLSAVLSGATELEYRMMLSVQAEKHLAINDVVVKNANPSRLATINVYIGPELLATYDADGLIVCTPTGSTAYNLSAGGPIMDPRADALAITPICPHSLSAKPIVLPADWALTVECDANNSTHLVCAVDGSDVFTLAPGERVTLSKSPHKLPVMTFTAEQDSFYAVLKRKLGWGSNPRAVVQARSNQPG